MTKEVWIVRGIVTDPEAHSEPCQIGDTEWQFSDGPPGARGSSADYINLQKGMKEHSGCILHFVDDPETDDETYTFRVRFEVPYHELVSYWQAECKYLSPIATLAGILQRDLYDHAGMTGTFEVEELL